MLLDGSAFDDSGRGFQNAPDGLGLVQRNLRYGFKIKVGYTVTNRLMAMALITFPINQVWITVRAIHKKGMNLKQVLVQGCLMRIFYQMVR